MRIQYAVKTWLAGHFWAIFWRITCKEIRTQGQTWFTVQKHPEGFVLSLVYWIFVNSQLKLLSVFVHNLWFMIQNHVHSIWNDCVHSPITCSRSLCEQMGILKRLFAHNKECQTGQVIATNLPLYSLTFQPFLLLFLLQEPKTSWGVRPTTVVK